MKKLANLEVFRDVLSSYVMSEASKRILRQTNLVLLVAPTSAGRNTIIRELLKTGDYYYIVSDTSRPPRVNDDVMEKDGVEYWFRSEQEMLQDLRGGKFLEAAIIHDQQVSGISIRELSRAKDEGKIAITDIEIIGVKNIMAVKADTHPIFVLPPSFEIWQQRIKHRGEMSKAEHRRRMESACTEFAAAIEETYYSFVINDDISSAVEQIHQLARLRTIDPERQARGRQLAEQLYIETKLYLG